MTDYKADLRNAAIRAMQKQGESDDHASELADRLVAAALPHLARRVENSKRPSLRCLWCGFWCDVFPRVTSSWSYQLEDVARCLNPVCECRIVEFSVNMMTYEKVERYVLKSRETHLHRLYRRDHDMSYAEFWVKQAEQWEHYRNARGAK